jgi:hypothetical protein
MTTRKLVLVAALALLATTASAVSPSAIAPGNAGGNKTLTVMTRNIYLGGDIALPLQAGGLPDALGRAFYVWQTVQGTDFPARAEALADEIAAAEPELLGLQEVSLWRTDAVSDELGPTGLPTDPLPFTPDAMTVAYDFLALLVDALAERGLAYDVVASQQNADLELPVPSPTSPIGLMDVRYTDFDVILARADTPGLHVSNPQGANFTARLTSVIAGTIPVTVLRGWTSVDVKYGGERFRLFNTHPEAFVEAIRLAQTAQLVGVVLASPIPVVVVGDLNSEPGTDPYELLTGVLTDAWTIAGTDDGFTCCQLSTLTNPSSLLDERIDLVLYRGPFEVLAIDVTGGVPLVPPLVLASPIFPYPPAALPGFGAGTPMYWGADHAGVVAQLRLTQEGFLSLE